MYSNKDISKDPVANTVENDNVDPQKISETYPPGVRPLVNLLSFEGRSPLTYANSVQLLINGEQKFPLMLDMLSRATDHIHLLYYIVDDDEIGKLVEEILIQKAQSGVDVRFLYDSFGSQDMNKGMRARLEQSGVQVCAFYPLHRRSWIGRINNRNHRKLLIVDGVEGLVGGINLSRRYDNTYEDQNPMYRRDTHLSLKGPAVHQLQHIFVSDWNFACDNITEPNEKLFPPIEDLYQKDGVPIQIVKSGPDSRFPYILHSLVAAIDQARETLYITTPYFAPDHSLMMAITLASHRGVDVKILLPHSGDTILLDLVTKAYISDLLKAGVSVYLYDKGFVHAKTCVIDGFVSIIGTANLDMRSFELNFEVNAVVYDDVLGSQMVELFKDDMQSAQRIMSEEWGQRSIWEQLRDRIIRLGAPLL